MRRLRRTRGVSLIEALVAMAVLAVGLLGVVGMQASLRFNADVSRQRAEAVRMAQESMEQLRAFGRLSGAPSGEHDYDKIVSRVDEPAAPEGFANTSFSRTVTVPATATDEPRMKRVQVRVDWLDRRTAPGGTPESVILNSLVARAAPEISASLGLPGDRAGPQRPQGRHPAIPQQAMSQAGNTSLFSPPGTLAQFTFDNATGLIVRACPGATACSPVSASLLSGFIQFASTGGDFSAAESEIPGGTPVSSVGITVVLTQPSAGTVTCVTASPMGSAVPYYCAMPLVQAVPQGRDTFTWTGSPYVTGIVQVDTATAIAATGSRVCRYTYGSGQASAADAARPFQYAGVRQALLHQNFLVISAAHLCPLDTPTTPLINGDTVWHPPRPDLPA